MTEDQFTGHQGSDLFDIEKTKPKLVLRAENLHCFKTSIIESSHNLTKFLPFGEEEVVELLLKNIARTAKLQIKG